MNTPSTDQDLRQRFSELRAEDLALAPAFASVTAGRVAARTRLSIPHAPRATQLWYAAGVAALTLIACVAVRSIHQVRARAAEAELQEWRRLTEWRAQTDHLLTLSDLPSPSGRGERFDGQLQPNQKTSRLPGSDHL